MAVNPNQQPTYTYKQLMTSQQLKSKMSEKRQLLQIQYQKCLDKYNNEQISLQNN